jgi:hypothetical protein
MVGATAPGPVHRLDRRPGRGQRPPARGRPLAQVPLRAEDPSGHRSLYAPTPQLAAFLTAAYRFDDVQGRPLQRPPLRPELDGPGQPPAVVVHHRTPHPSGLAAPAVPTPLVRTTWCVGLLDLPARRLLPGSARKAGPATAVASGTALTTSTSWSPPTPPSLASTWAPSARPPTGPLRLRLSPSPTIPSPPHHHHRGPRPADGGRHHMRTAGA